MSKNNDDILHIILNRQFDSYLLPFISGMDHTVENRTINDSTINFQSNVVKNDENLHFWINFLMSVRSSFIKNLDIQKFIENLFIGLPNDLRGLIYIKVLNVDKKFINKNNFNHFLKLFKTSDLNGTHCYYIDNLDLSSKSKDILKVFHFCLKKFIRVISLETHRYSNPVNFIKNNVHLDLSPNNFIINFCNILSTNLNLSEDDVCFILFKFNKILTSLNLEEMFYKINRSLENSNKSIYQHITSQDINLNEFYNNFLYNFLSINYFDEKILLKIADCFIFFGFELVLYILTWLINENSDEIMMLKNKDLKNYLNSKKFYNKKTLDLNQVLKQDSKLTKYENELFLNNFNFFSENYNQLYHLKKINNDLNIKISQMKQNLLFQNNECDLILNNNKKIAYELNTAMIEKQNLIQLHETFSKKLNLK